MPYTYRIEPDNNLLFIFGDGVVTQAERMEAMKTWMADPDYRPGLNTLFDLSKSESTPTLAEIRAISDYMQRNADAIGRKKVAIVVAEAVNFGVARQFAALTESNKLEIQVFGSREEAWTWLDPRH